MENQNNSPFLYLCHNCFNSLKHLINSDTSIQRQSRNTGIPNIPAIKRHVSVAILTVHRSLCISTISESDCVLGIPVSSVVAADIIVAHRPTNCSAGAATLILLCFHRDKILKVIIYIHKY